MALRDIVRVAALHIGVPDPGATAAFFEEALEFHRISFEDREDLTADGEYGLGPPPSMLTLVRAPRLTVERLVLEFAADADPQDLVDRLNRADVGHNRVGAGTTIVFEDPDGITVECRHRVPPLEHRLSPSAIRPRKLGHINLKVPDAERSARFWMDTVGLALSERVGDLLWFFRAGSDHHNLGLRGQAAETSVHHIGFELDGWDVYRSICDRLAKLGHRVEYGPGRHGPGNNIFTYLRDPSSGLRIELYADMARIDDDAAYEPPVWEVGDRSITVNRWGPAPPESFLE